MLLSEYQSFGNTLSATLRKSSKTKIAIFQNYKSVLTFHFLALTIRIDFEFGSGMAYLKTYERRSGYNSELKLKVGMKHDMNTWQWQMQTTSLKKRVSFERLTFSNEFPEYIRATEIHSNPETSFPRRICLLGTDIFFLYFLIL